MAPEEMGRLERYALNADAAAGTCTYTLTGGGVELVAGGPDKPCAVRSGDLLWLIAKAREALAEEALPVPRPGSRWRDRETGVEHYVIQACGSRREFHARYEEVAPDA